MKKYAIWGDVFVTAIITMICLAAMGLLSCTGNKKQNDKNGAADDVSELIIPANISILPVYILHQTLIIVFGFYIVSIDLNMFIKFGLIAFTAIPASILLYQLIRTNNISRFIFGLKPLMKPPK